MYGGMDRQSVPQQKQADEQLIAGTTKEFGSREKASDAFVDQGVRYYMLDNYAAAMRRFNQAWLLNPKNPEAFWGFAMVFHDEGKNCEARNWIDRALELNLSKPIALADAGRIYTLCAVSNQSLELSTKNQQFSISEELYKKADSISPNNDYVYSSWATAYYWRGDYARAWEMVARARAVGHTFHGPFINLLRQKMPEPRS
jgi:Flp pilus assembly protein TadD